MSALSYQVGGGHYVKYPIQPNHFVAANNWDAFAQNILKYLVRWRDKHGPLDLDKALQYAHQRIELRMEFHRHHDDGRPSISMNTFIRENGIDPEMEPVLLALELWVMSSGNSHNIRSLFVTTLEAYIEFCNAPEDSLFPQD